MSFEMAALLIFSTLILFFILSLVLYFKPKRLKKKQFRAKWRVLQSYCADKEKWAEAVIEADRLLGEALKKRKVKGKNMGERMVTVQKRFSDNDGLWYAHKLARKMSESPRSRLKEEDVKKALIAFRQSLKDIGAL